ncbi:hypothetical protein ACH4PU_27615 [Streptomyces sp. NPDC021100]|uniref:hypothetical protein n=1 Tax=Streptomyces sp. NPDC021100 TaxID=3365114 RepID=UPI0037A2C023
MEVRSYLRRLRRWQTLAAAVVTALLALVGTVVGAVITSSSHDDDSAGPRAGTPPMGRESTPPLSLGITSVTERAVGPGAREYEFVGRVAGLPEHWSVYVIVENPAPELPRPVGSGPAPGPTVHSSGGRWLVSPSATVDKAGRWEVRWRVERLPLKVTWRAAVFDNGCDREKACSATPASPPSLVDEGPAAGGVRATATFR